jgi:hypothetical protein
MTPLSERLKDWKEIDGALYDLGVVLGLWQDTPEGGFWLRQAPKWVFWTNNPIGNALYETLQRLVAIGVLEVRQNDELEYRWNSQTTKSLLESKQ